MKKKIAILYSGANNWGGIEKYLSDFLAHRSDKVEFVLISMGSWDLTEKLKGELDTFVLPGFRANPFLIFKIRSILKKNNIDTLISQGVVSNFYARATTLICKVNQISIIHSELDKEYKNPLIRSAYLFSDWLLKFRTKKFICVSKYLKTILIKRGISEKKIHVIHNGVNFLSPKEVTVKGGNNVVIGSVGRLEREKGMDLLIKASKYLPGNFEIRICGDGSERKVLEQLIDSESVSKKVKLLGFMDDINSFYYELDLYVQPSRSEGFGLTVVEAMMAGTPVLVNNKGALPEILENGKYGRIFKSEDPKEISKAIVEAVLDKAKEKEALRAKEFAIKNYDLRTWRENLIKEILAV